MGTAITSLCILKEALTIQMNGTMVSNPRIVTKMFATTLAIRF